MTSCYNLVTVVIDNFIIPYKKKIDLSQCRVQGGGQLPDQIGALLYILAPLLSARPTKSAPSFMIWSPSFFPFSLPPHFPLFLPLFSLSPRFSPFFPYFSFPPFFGTPFPPFLILKTEGGSIGWRCFPSLSLNLTFSGKCSEHTEMFSFWAL